MSITENNLEFDQWLSGFEYPYETRYFKFESQGESLSMAYMYIPASSNDKATVTLFHGKNFNGAYWKSTAELLIDKGYGVLIPDQIGFGKSSKSIDYQYSFEVLANNTRLLMQSLNLDKSILVGHSMGGMLAARFALMYPEIVNELVLVNPIGLENYLHFTEYKDIDFFYKNELKKTPVGVVNYQKKNYYDGKWTKAYSELTLPLVGWINGPDWNRIAKVNALTYDMIFTGPVIEEFKYLSMPTSLILGTRDRTGPGRGWKKSSVNRELGRYDLLGKEVKQRNSKINIVELDGLGHLPHIENFTRFSEALNAIL